MDCEHTGRLAAWLDGELTAAETAALDAHVAQCSACRERAVLLRRTYAALEMLEPVEVPEGLAARVRARTRRRLHKAPVYVAGALAAAAVFLMALTLRSPAVDPGRHVTASTAATSSVRLAAYYDVALEEVRMLEDMQLLHEYDVLADLELLAIYDMLLDMDEFTGVMSI